MAQRKFLVAFLIIVAVVGGGYFVWNRYMSPEAKLEKYFDIYRNDTYGGKTPQKTLDLFVKALEANDIELASKYFMPDEKGSYEEWKNILIATKDAGNMPALIDAVKILKPEPQGIIGDVVYEMTATDERGKLLVDLIFKFNGRIWKIDALF